MAASRILVGYDGSPHAEDAVALARVIATGTGAEIVLGQVVPWGSLAMSAVPIPELREHYERHERQILEELRRAADRHGVAAEAGPGRSPAQGLHELAEELQPELVVVGSSHRGKLGQVLAGNVAVQLLNGLDRPLAVPPAGYAEHPSRPAVIGVGYDESPEASAALAEAGSLARALGAEVEVISVAAPHVDVAPHPWAAAWAAGTSEEVDERLVGRVKSAAGGLPAGVRSSTRVEPGGAVEVLLDAARSLDLLVVGSRGYGPARRLLLGSVSSRIVREAPCPVLVTPRVALTASELEPASLPGAALA